MIITDEQLQDNPRMRQLVANALQKEKHVLPTQLLITHDEPKRNKYGVDISEAGKEKRTYKDGTLFASIDEMERWDYLLKIQQAGEITNLRRQVEYVLQEQFFTIQYGKIDQIIYVADFVYLNITYRKGYENMEIVEDSKSGVRTDTYKLKRKLFLAKYPTLPFFEV